MAAIRWPVYPPPGVGPRYTRPAMLVSAERAPHRPAPPLLAAELGPAVMADDPCEPAFGGADPSGPRKYYRARYYDPNIGRFISEDPIGLSGGVNFYAYANDSPDNLTDPFGLDAITQDSNGRCCMCEMWRDAGYGFNLTERASWIIDSGTYNCMRWPWSATNKKETWNGPVPEGSVAIAHTHPTRVPSSSGTAASAWPSSGDEDTAKHLGMPIYVISDIGVTKYDPKTKKQTQEEHADVSKWCEKKK
jgi:RHS repeat-associated protein